ncbi:unnamed protein product [Schistocephalus solidus]|uniref:C2H2-type domain-containing protein n=1 Tax=Schistocephalus solidus TaxID=70667 RepID=A0A183SDB0_SCHSO|nr:unnamed protein product [Schistocephalus solidus]
MTSASVSENIASANPAPDPTMITTATTSHTRTIEVTSSDYLPLGTTTTNSDGDSNLTCRHCDRTFTSLIGLVGHLRIQRTEPG